jgi:hypothetical protein
MFNYVKQNDSKKQILCKNKSICLNTIDVQNIYHNKNAYSGILLNICKSINQFL